MLYFVSRSYQGEINWNDHWTLNLLVSLALSVGDLVRFRKKELSMVQIVGKILSIKENTYHVKTFFPFSGIDEFYLDIKEIKKYDTTSYSNSNQEDRDDQ